MCAKLKQKNRHNSDKVNNRYNIKNVKTKQYLPHLLTPLSWIYAAPLSSSSISILLPAPPEGTRSKDSSLIRATMKGEMPKSLREKMESQNVATQ